MNLDDFAASLVHKQLTLTDRAVAVLWYKQQEDPTYVASASELLQTLRGVGLAQGKIDGTEFYSTLKQHQAVFQCEGRAHHRDKRAVYFSIVPSFREKLQREYASLAENSDGVALIIRSLESIAPRVIDVSERSFFEETITCVRHEAFRASIVLGWCVAIHRMRKKVEAMGFEAFNQTSSKLKAQTSGKYKRWTKEFSVTTFAELQTTVFDTALITVLEGMGLIDGPQAQRLESCFEYRCHSAHPGEAPIRLPHAAAFFHDIVEIILANPKFAG